MSRLMTAEEHVRAIGEEREALAFWRGVCAGQARRLQDRSEDLREPVESWSRMADAHDDENIRHEVSCLIKAAEPLEEEAAQLRRWAGEP